jgi:hypothetical protein
MTVDQIRDKVIAFVRDLHEDGARDYDILLAVDMILVGSLRALPPESRLAISKLFMDTIQKEGGKVN